MNDRIAEELMAQRDASRFPPAMKQLGQAAKDAPDVWVVVGMVVQWLVGKFGADYGISYDTIVAAVQAISDATQSTDGGSMTVLAALVFAVGRLGYKYFRR